MPPWPAFALRAYPPTAPVAVPSSPESDRPARLPRRPPFFPRIPPRDAREQKSHNRLPPAPPSAHTPPPSARLSFHSPNVGQEILLLLNNFMELTTILYRL